MKSSEIKALLKKEGIPYWKLGAQLNVSEATVLRTLRQEEIPADKSKEILNAIKALKKGKERKAL